MLDMIEIGLRIRETRKKSGMTQSDLAKMLFISTQSISKWERGLSVPEISNFKMISNIFGVSIDYLIGND